jgi:Tol biopolymer transport system component
MQRWQTMRHLSKVLCGVAVVATAACNNRANVQCETDPNCNLTTGGVCAVVGTGNHWCAYPDPGCPGGFRFSDQDVGDGVSGACVPSEIDAGVDAAVPVTDGDTTCKLRVVFVDGKPPFSGQDDGSGQREVWTANPDGSGLVNLSNNEAADDAHPSWSPDGFKVAFASNRSNNAGHYQIFVVNVDGTGLTNLTPTLLDASMPSWSPDGTRIAFARSGNVWTMNADGSGAAQLTTLSAGTVARIVAWSADGKQLLYDQSPQSGNITNSLYVANVGTAGVPTKLNTGNSQELGDGWAPFSRIVLDNRFDVFTVNGDGSSLVNVTKSTDTSTQIGGAVATNSGNTIVFYRSRADDSNHFDLWSIPAVGGVAVQVTNTNGTRSSDLATSASPDGSTISLRRVTDTVQGTNVVVTTQIGTVGTDGNGLHLFNAPGGSNANEVSLSAATCH